MHNTLKNSVAYIEAPNWRIVTRKDLTAVEDTRGYLDSRRLNWGPRRAQVTDEDNTIGFVVKTC